jgi:type II secretory pathway pseudopilin PulG
MRVVRKTQCGTTMPELLVAMLVLLVGIWVVAAKFPKLTEIMRGERLRDQMARMAEQQLENARDGVEWLPIQIAVCDPTLASPANVYGIDEALSPFYNAGDEPNWEDQLRPRNVIENTLLILGETFRVPAPGPDATDPQAPYFPKCGPAEFVWWVYQPIPLTRDDDIDPGTAVTPLPGTFYAETAGTLRLVPPERDPQGNPFTPAVAAGLGGAVLEVAYAWVDAAGREHWMQGESVICQPVGPLTGLWTSAVLEGVAAGGGIVPGSVTATFRSPYDVQNYTGVPVPTANPPIAALDQRYGQAIWFNASEQGKTLCVGYRLRTYANPADATDPDIGRRIPLVRELHRVPDDPVDPVAGTYEMTLDHRKLEDEIPLFAVDLSGTPLAAPYDQVHVLAFDTETGDLYTDADGTITVDYVAAGTRGGSPCTRSRPPRFPRRDANWCSTTARWTESRSSFSGRRLPSSRTSGATGRCRCRAGRSAAGTTRRATARRTTQRARPSSYRTAACRRRSGWSTSGAPGARSSCTPWAAYRRRPSR